MQSVSRRNALNASPTINPFTVQRAGPRCEQPAALNPETDFRDPGFHGSYGQDGEGESLSTSSHSARSFAARRHGSPPNYRDLTRILTKKLRRKINKKEILRLFPKKEQQKKNN